LKSWKNEVVPMTLKGQIAVPYTWWVGETGSRFFVALQDAGKIMGNICPGCGTVFVPPRKNCGRCFVEINDWIELSPEGVVTAHTIVRYPFRLQPASPPFAYAIIRLDGADVGLIHIIRDNLDSLKNGARVRARFKDKRLRTGSILDIDAFELV
jgi:uncharacterized OB-fold protein